MGKHDDRLYVMEENHKDVADNGTSEASNSCKSVILS